MENVDSLQSENTETLKANPQPTGDPKQNLACIVPGFLHFLDKPRDRHDPQKHANIRRPPWGAGVQAPLGGRRAGVHISTGPPWGPSKREKKIRRPGRLKRVRNPPLPSETPPTLQTHPLPYPPDPSLEPLSLQKPCAPPLCMSIDTRCQNRVATSPYGVS